MMADYDIISTNRAQSDYDVFRSSSGEDPKLGFPMIYILDWIVDYGSTRAKQFLLKTTFGLIWIFG